MRHLSVRNLEFSNIMFIYIFSFSVLPLYVHIKTIRNALSAERVYDIHCVTYGSRPSALVTWWLGTTQLLDHSSQVRKFTVAAKNVYPHTSEALSIPQKCCYAIF